MVRPNRLRRYYNNDYFTQSFPDSRYTREDYHNVPIEAVPVADAYYVSTVHDIGNYHGIGHRGPGSRRARHYFDDESLDYRPVRSRPSHRYNYDIQQQVQPHYSSRHNPHSQRRFCYDDISVRPSNDYKDSIFDRSHRRRWMDYEAPIEQHEYKEGFRIPEFKQRRRGAYEMQRNVQDRALRPAKKNVQKSDNFNQPRDFRFSNAAPSHFMSSHQSEANNGQNSLPYYGSFPYWKKQKKKNSGRKTCVVVLLVLITAFLAGICAILTVVLVTGDELFAAKAPYLAEQATNNYYTDNRSPSFDTESLTLLFNDDDGGDDDNLDTSSSSTWTLHDTLSEFYYYQDGRAREGSTNLRQVAPSLAPVPTVSPVNASPIPDDDTVVAVPDDDTVVAVPDDDTVVTAPDDDTVVAVPDDDTPVPDDDQPPTPAPVALPPVPIQTDSPISTVLASPCEALDCGNMYYNYYIRKKKGRKKDKFYIEREKLCDDDDSIPDDINGEPSFNDDEFRIEEGTYDAFWELIGRPIH